MSKFNAETTTDQVLQNHDLSGKLVIVTGGASGIGQETVRALCEKGATVVMPVRSAAKCDEAAAAIRALSPSAKIKAMPCDLASLASIRAFAAAFLAEHNRLDLLINNAGIMAAPLMRTADGFEMQFGVCHLGHFLLTNLLTPALLAAAPARIVNLSSRGHQRGTVNFDDPNFERRDYDKWRAYGQAKTANILFSVELERRLSSRGVHAYAVHPGTIMTQLGRHLSAQDMADLRASIAARGDTNMKMKSVAQGAATTLYAATALELEGRGGVYLEDCRVATVNDEATVPTGVRSYALNADDAKRLWDLSEQLVGQSFPIAE